MTSPPWALRYAPHISFRGRALFQDCVGSTEPADLVHFIADQGFAGFQDPMAASRPAAEQTRIGQAAADRGLQTGCFVFPSSAGAPPFRSWGALDHDGRNQVMEDMKEAIAVASRIGSRHVAVLSTLDPGAPKWMQLAAMAQNLRPVADLASEAGLTLVLESTDARRLPGMLMDHLSDAASVVRQAAHASVRLVFDTAHVQAMDGDLLANLRAVFDLVDLVQLADHPGRCEPGSGEINFETFLAELHRLEFRGLCELEHLWSSPGRETEESGLAALRTLDARAAARAQFQ